MSSRYRVAQHLELGVEIFGRQIEDLAADAQELPGPLGQVLWWAYLPLAALCIVIATVVSKLAVPVARALDAVLGAGVWPVLRSLDDLRSAVPSPFPARAERLLVWLLVGLCGAIMIAYVPIGLYRITWDTPGEMSADGALYTDEGFYSTDAITWYLEGTWYTPNEYNQYIALPLLQYIQGACFVLFGLSLATVRVLNFAFTMGWLAAVFVLYRRFLGWKWAFGGVTLIAINHATFGMSRFALAEMPMAFFVTWSIVCALYARGRYAYVLAASCALLYSCAVLTKVNTVFLAPVVALIMIFVDFRWKPILLKFLLCSAIFFLPISLHYLLVVKPHWLEFQYFFTLNVTVANARTFLGILENMPWTHAAIGEGDSVLFGMIDLPWLGLQLPVSPTTLAVVMALLVASGYRRHPLLWLCVLWYALFIFLFAYYGRIYLRFFTISYVGLHGMMLVALWALWRTRHHFNWLVLCLFAAFILWSTVLNIHRIYLYVFDAENTYNEYAADVQKMLDADTRPNGKIVMGHHAASLALRVKGLLPRHDRYGMQPFEQRLLIHNPGWYTSEFNMRFNEFHAYFQHHEWVERFYRNELMGTYFILKTRTSGFSYRGYPVAFYRLVPRAEEIEAYRATPPPTRQVYD